MRLITPMRLLNMALVAGAMYMCAPISSIHASCYSCAPYAGCITPPSGGGTTGAQCTTYSGDNCAMSEIGC